jgi:hypothetical protein
MSTSNASTILPTAPAATPHNPLLHASLLPTLLRLALPNMLAMPASDGTPKLPT